MIEDPKLKKQLAQIIAETSRREFLPQFLKTWFPESFNRPFEKPHWDLLQALQEDDPNLVIAGSRGLGKTTMTLGYLCQEILFYELDYICYVSDTEPLAQAYVDNFVDLIESSKLIKLYFGEVKKHKQETCIDLTIGKKLVRIAWRGAGQQVRGLIWRSRRPQVIIFDDMESTKSTKDIESTNALKKKIYTDFFPLPDITKYFRRIYLGTVSRDFSLISLLLSSGDWKKVIAAIVDEQGKTLAPLSYPQDLIDSIRRNYEELGELESFYQEYAMKTVSETKVFDAGKVKFFDERSIDFENGDYITLVLADIARTVKTTSSYTCLVVISVNVLNGDVFLRDELLARLQPSEIHQNAILMCEQWKADALGVETQGLEQHLLEPLRNAILLSGITIILFKLKTSMKANSKDYRIRALQPLYKKGRIFHSLSLPVKSQTGSGTIFEQLANYPNVSLVDGIDCLSHILPVLDTNDWQNGELLNADNSGVIYYSDTLTY